MCLSPEYYAQEVRCKLGLAGPINIVEAARDLGVDVCEEALEGSDGILLKVEGNAVILINSNCVYETRKRFTIAHEIGHFYMPHHNLGKFVCTISDIPGYVPDGKLEQEADRFASELLLPLHELEGQLKHSPSIDTVRRIATHYGTSLTATALKVVEATCEPRSQENRKRLRTTNPPQNAHGYDLVAHGYI